MFSILLLTLKCLMLSMDAKIQNSHSAHAQGCNAGLQFQQIPWDGNSVVLDLRFSVWLWGLSHQDFSCCAVYPAMSALNLCSHCHRSVRRACVVPSPGRADEQGSFAPGFLQRLLRVSLWQCNFPKQSQITVYYTNSLLMSRGGSYHILVIFIKLLWGMKPFISVIH